MRVDPIKRSPQSDADRASLPAGRVCGECSHYESCRRLFGCHNLSEVCDWAPSHFGRAYVTVPGEDGARCVAVTVERPARAGFTLIDLLVVIVIIGLVSAVVVPVVLLVCAGLLMIVGGR
jgi:prepilin-type N-terminal cleavage/methylation domain-containing protein